MKCVVCDSQLLEARQNFTATSLGLLSNWVYVNWVYVVCDSQLLEARQNFTATSLSLLRNWVYVNWVYVVCDSQLLEARQNFTATSLGLLRNWVYVNLVYVVCDSQLLEARQNFTATSLGLLRNYRKRQQLTALLKSLRTIKTLVSWFHCFIIRQSDSVMVLLSLLLLSLLLCYACDDETDAVTEKYRSVLKECPTSAVIITSTVVFD